MAYETKSRVEMPHNVIIEGRERLNISGVEDVERFDEESIVVYTSRGLLIVQGSDLHIEKLSLDGGELAVEGEIHSLRYEEETKEKGSLLARLFK
ncbi:MAG: sporulation protein YabP [Oscillospiraceae bacterium]|nr:sporulation protein YabP [Oscillospiraceae bacterium]